MTRTGKIARLPQTIREELNRRLADGEAGIKLVAWLNTLQKVKRVVAQDFCGREVTKGNLHEWKQGGFVEWQMQREALVCAQSLASKGRALKAVAQGPLADHLAMMLAARYGQLIAGWNGEVDEAFEKKLRGLRLMCQDIAVLRRGDHREGQLQLAWDFRAYEKKTDGNRALEHLLKGVKNCPESLQAFREAMAIHERFKEGKKRLPEMTQPVRPSST